MCRINKQITLNVPFLVEGEKVLLQTKEEILRLPNSQRRTDLQSRRRRSLARGLTESDEFFLEPRFGVSERQWIQLSQYPNARMLRQVDRFLMRTSDTRLPAARGWRLLSRIKPKL